MFCDKTKVKFIGGRGGDGCVSFRKEKYVPKGGPDGGDGGHGGNIILIADPNINTLSDFNRRKHFHSEDGTAGAKKNQTGATGEDLILKVPVGTMVFSEEGHHLLADLKNPLDQHTIAKGGKGGLGNARFVSSIHQAPRFAENGEKGQEVEVVLELKMVADVGIIGMPSAGKSTLISVISNARPKIAAYPFTTLIPNLGVVEMKQFGGSKNQTFIAADIPGLIPGAHKGKGLGYDFLRHISRTHILVHLLDATHEDIVEDFYAINEELKLYDEATRDDIRRARLLPLGTEEQIVAINKIDTLSLKDLRAKIKKMEKKYPALKGRILPISAVTGKGIKELVFTIWEAREKLQKKLETMREEFEKKEAKQKEFKVFRPLEESRPDRFEIEIIHRKDGTKHYKITGDRIEQMVHMTDFSNQEGVERVQRHMKKSGISKGLVRYGALDGDTIIIGEQTLKFRS